MIYTLLLLDERNQTFQRMDQINETRNDHISKNVVSMWDAGMRIQIRQIDFKDSASTVLNGWKEDGALYERLLMEYGDKTGQFLKAWVL